jgi:hypothetical protein
MPDPGSWHIGSDVPDVSPAIRKLPERPFHTQMQPRSHKQCDGGIQKLLIKRALQHTAGYSAAQRASSAGQQIGINLTLLTVPRYMHVPDR